eukprot:scaffold106_cov380-Prasinococcus_capsulatus_cf.AAC.7
MAVRGALKDAATPCHAPAPTLALAPPSPSPSLSLSLSLSHQPGCPAASAAPRGARRGGRGNRRGGEGGSTEGWEDGVSARGDECHQTDRCNEEGALPRRWLARWTPPQTRGAAGPPAARAARARGLPAVPAPADALPAAAARLPGEKAPAPRPAHPLRFARCGARCCSPQRPARTSAPAHLRTGRRRRSQRGVSVHGWTAAAATGSVLICGSTWVDVVQATQGRQRRLVPRARTRRARSLILGRRGSGQRERGRRSRRHACRCCGGAPIGGGRRACRERARGGELLGVHVDCALALREGRRALRRLCAKPRRSSAS